MESLTAKFWKKNESDIMRKIVIPGEVVSTERKRLGSNVFIQNGKICSEVLGVMTEENDTASVVALKGVYVPKQNDIIVGIISSEKFAGYTVNINCFFDTFISKKEFREQVGNGTVVSAMVARVSELNEVDLEGVRTFFGGEVLKISPVKIPRVIGKNNSMLNVLKNYTKANIVVGRNGLIWVKGENTDLLVKALEIIEKEAHKEHLTERIEAFLKEETEKRKKEPKK